MARRRIARTVPKRQTMWVRNVHNSGANPVLAYGQPLIPGDVLDPGARVGSTVVRTVGDLTITSGPVSSAVGHLAIGLLVMDTTSWTDATQPPVRPVGHRNLSAARWMHWRYFSLASLAKHNPANANVFGQFDYHWDVTVNRRMSGLGDNLVLTLEIISFPENTGLVFGSSTLIKLA